MAFCEHCEAELSGAAGLGARRWDPRIRKSKRRELLLTIASGRAAISPGELGAGELVTARDEFDFAAAAGPASTQDPPAAMSSTRPSISVMEPPRSVSGARYSHPRTRIRAGKPTKFEIEPVGNPN